MSDRDTALMRKRFEAEIRKISLLHGEARLSEIRAIVDRQSAAGDVEAKILWLKSLLRTAWKEARLDYTLRAFAELRDIYASDPRYADLRRDILWYYKWLAEETPEHIEVSRATIEQLFLEMEAFYTAEREALRPIYGLRCHAAICMGRREEADRWYEKWQAAPAGKSDDCAACEAARKILYFLFTERDADAMAAAEPILRDKVFCEETPETLTRLMGLALRTGRHRLAMVLLRATRRSVRRVRSMQSALAAQVICQLLMGNQQRSRRLALLAMRRAKEARNDLDLFNTYRAAGLWAASTVIVTRQNDKGFPSRLMPIAKADYGPTIPLTEMAAVCFEAARDFAARFDARNETKRFSDGLNELEEAIRKMATREENGRIG